MSTNHVTLIGGDSSEGRQIVTVDRFNNALVVQDEIHQNIHRGIQFAKSRYIADYDNSTNYDLAIIVTDSMHMRYDVHVSVNSLLRLYSDTVLDDPPGGTAVAARNKNLFSSITPTSTTIDDPTVVDAGTIIYESFVPGGHGRGSTGGTEAGFGEWVLSPGTYLLRLVNLDVNNSLASMTLNFYEPGQSPDVP